MKMDIILTVLLTLSVTRHCGGQTFNGQDLAEKLEKFADESMGVSSLQRHYDDLAYNRTSVHGDKLVDELASKIGQKFYLLKEAALKIKESVEKRHQLFPEKIEETNMENCCQATNVNESLRFQTKVSETAACLTESPKSPSNRRFPDDSIEEVMMQNYVNNPNLLWQYFGSEDGTSILYPKAIVTPLCSSFDPRFQPYYTAAATPIAKDIVIVMDTSTSMESATDTTGGSRLKLAKDVATTLIHTLNLNDRMAVVSFDSSAGKPTEGCYASRLSLHTTDNAKRLTAFINNLNVGHDGSDYSKGLEAAFQYFIDSPATDADEERYRVILLLTDGTDSASTSGKHPLDVIRDENEKLGNSVHIMAYGLGNGIANDDYSIDLLLNMSLQHRNNITAGPIRRGFLEIIKNSANLRSKMGTYYSFFKKDAQSDEAIFSVPFLDTFSGVGLLISVCLPAYDNSSNLLGVACADIKLSDLFSEVTVFSEGASSYVFIIDNYGRTLKHPLLPLPRTVKDSYSIRDITYLERATGTDEVISAMKRRLTGHATIRYSTKTMARGVILKEGILTGTREAIYYYAPVPNSTYSLCVVVGHGYELATLPPHTPTLGVFVYHRRDLYEDNLNSCTHLHSRATIDHSVVKFNVNAFIDPADYLYKEDTSAIIKAYTDFFTGKSTINPGFKPGVLDAVLISHNAEKFWLSNQQFALFMIWRYFGTKQGVFRTYPGHGLAPNYDHELRPWWRRAIAQRGNIVVTTPYVDAGGAGWVVSICHTIYTGRSNGVHTETDEVEGVLCCDVGLSYLYQLLLEIYSTCKLVKHTCMIVDNSGFIVMHPQFVDASVEDQGEQRRDIIEDIHIVHQESDLAQDLINKGVLSKQSCADFDNHKQQFTYRIRLNMGETHIKADNYELWAVENTNVFLIRKDTSHMSSQCCEDKTMVAPDIKLCTKRACDCLCYNPIPFDSCMDSVSKVGTSSTCISKTPDSSSTAPPDNISGLTQCFDPRCESRSTDFDCYSVTSCSWCYRNQNTLLSHKCCRNVDTCLFGVVLPGKSNACPIPAVTTQAPDKPTESADTAAIVGGTIAGVLVLILIVIVLIVWYRHHQPKEDAYSESVGYITPISVIRGCKGPIEKPECEHSVILNTPWGEASPHSQLYIHPANANLYSAPVESSPKSAGPIIYQPQNTKQMAPKAPEENTGM